MCNVIIKKGDHYSNMWFRFPFVSFKRSISGSVKFLGDFRYDSNNDTNKLIGLSDSIHHHLYSIRLGWRFNSKTDLLEVLVIHYTNGIRVIKPICNVNSDKLYKYKIIIHKNSYEIIFGNQKTELKRTSKWFLPRLVLKPYFGGKNKAPKTFKFKLKWNI